LIFLRFSILCLTALLASVLATPSACQPSDDPTETRRSETLRQYGLDPTTSLESRVRETPAPVLKVFAIAGLPAPTHHALTEPEQRKLAAAFAALPPLLKRILSGHMRSVTFLDGMPNTALTSTVNPGRPYRLCDITIRAGILQQTVSEWLTEKEQTCFSTGGSPVSVSIEAGKRDALVYVLLHEATHIADFGLRITPTEISGQPLGKSEFTDGVWSERTVPAPAYRDPLRERVRFYFGKEKVDIDQAEAVYQSLRQTPFVSLYGASNCSDDLAEYVAVYHWTQVIKQPYRIVVRKEGRVVFTYEPMKSTLVRSRIGQMKRFYGMVIAGNPDCNDQVAPKVRFCSATADGSHRSNSMVDDMRSERTEVGDGPWHGVSIDG
jgi:hypothetical protein